VFSCFRGRLLALAALLLLASGCGGQKPTAASLPPLDVAAERYVRLALALGDRDTDSLDSYHGPPEWQADARARHAPLPEIRADATVLADSLAAARADASDDEVRRAFLVRQLRAIASRVDILPNDRINPLFYATVQATEEAIVNAMLAAETMTGADGLRVFALPHDRLMAAMRKYGRVK